MLEYTSHMKDAAFLEQIARWRAHADSDGLCEKEEEERQATLAMKLVNAEYDALVEELV